MTELSSASVGRADPPLRSAWQEPARGGYPDPALFGLSGRDQLQAMLAGQAPQPPMSRLTGLRLSAVGEGIAAFQMPLSQWLASSAGTISVGPIAIPADAAVACAIQTALPAATPFSTSELSLRLLSPIRPGGTLTATGRLIALEPTIGLAEVTVTDEDGRLLAHGSSMCFLQAPLSPAPVPPSLPAEPRPEGHEEQDRDPDPHLRPARGLVLSKEVRQARGGLEVLRAQLNGSLPLPPIHHLTGLIVQEAAPGRARFSMPSSEWFCAPAAGRVQGGFVALLADAALSGAIATRLPAGTTLSLVDLKVNYLRPLRADGRIAHASGKVVHIGRRTAVATAEVHDGDGRPVALATGSALVLTDSPATHPAA
ncbi:MAG: PaaI family thioesterase [Actinomycetota bacterium]|nr:PaaI family thioesterase [Actinomycetota bacterium]